MLVIAQKAAAELMTKASTWKLAGIPILLAGFACRHSARFRRASAIFEKERQARQLSYPEYLALERLTFERNRSPWLREIEAFPSKPLVSIVVPVYNTPPRLLRKCIASVRRQIYANWELCLVDDASPSPSTQRQLARFARRDKRIRIEHRETNGGIARATNDGIAMARGDFIAFLDHDDELADDALFHVVRKINETPDADVLFTDQDKITDRGLRFNPFFKPGWSPSCFRAIMYLGHLLVFRTSLIRETGGCDPAFDGVQDFELALRLTEKARHVAHIPRIAYHWRATRGSIAASPTAKSNIPEIQRRAVQCQIDRLGIHGVAVSVGERHRVQVDPKPDAPAGLVSVILCSKDAGELVSQCLDSLFAITRGTDFEVLVGDNGTADPAAKAAFARHPIRRFAMPGPFHFAAFNNQLAREAKGDCLLFLDGNTEILQGDWIARMLLHASAPSAGAVGARLVYPDGTIQHAGVVLGPHGTAGHLFRDFQADSDFHHGIIGCDREVSAVSAACLLVSAEAFRKVGGFDELFRHHYEDVDLCLRLRRAGYANRYAGSVKLVLHESKTRDAACDYTDRMLLLDRWDELIRQGDPHSNPNFLAGRTDFAMGPGELFR
ncbi:MAG: glycosyltransferase family 2 protein [Kiritimatiellia bacterium]|jgi:GT2 family glycosyltransferase